jgi:hypothetical protein
MRCDAGWYELHFTGEYFQMVELGGLGEKKPIYVYKCSICGYTESADKITRLAKWAQTQAAWDIANRGARQ